MVKGGPRATRTDLPKNNQGVFDMPKTLSMKLAGSAALAALLLGAAPAALYAETPADTLVIADAIDDIITFDPQESFELSTGDALNNIYDGLIEIDPTTDGKLMPGLAESWSLADDGVTFTFKMKSGITFSSGNPVRAEDAAFSLHRAVKLNKNPSFILTQFGFTPENVEEKIKADGDTLTIVTDKPYAPSFLYNCLTATIGNVVDKETVMANEVNGDMGNEWLRTNSAGTGPYILRSWKSKESYLLEAREGHWRGDAILKRVFMRHIPEGATNRLLLEKGDLDMSREMFPVDIAGVEGNADITVLNDTGGQLYYLGLNQKVEAFKNPKVLEAVRYAIDYDGLAGTLLKGQWVKHQAFLPKGYLGAVTDTPYSLDIAKAKSLLAEAGMPEISTSIIVRNVQERMDIATSLQNTFGQAGIKLELKVGDGAEGLGIYRARQHEITLQTWGPDYPDPNTNASTFAENPGNADEDKNTGYLAWRNAYEPGDMMAQSQAAVVEKDSDKRAAMYDALQRQYMKEAPIIVMFQQAQQNAIRSNLKDVYTGGATGNIAYWLISK